MNKRYAIVGSHSTGKSTLLESVGNNLPSYELMNEIARDQIKILGKNPQNMTDTEIEYFQRLLLTEQIKKESLYEQRGENFISDRSVIDVLAYSKGVVSDDVYDILEGRVRDYLKHKPYTKIFMLPIEFELENDGIRYEGEDFRQIIENRILKLLKEFKIEYIELRGNIDERRSIMLQNL